jgi:hypothetical protein
MIVDCFFDEFTSMVADMAIVASVQRIGLDCHKSCEHHCDRSWALQQRTMSIRLQTIRLNLVVNCVCGVENWAQWPISNYQNTKRKIVYGNLLKEGGWPFAYHSPDSGWIIMTFLAWLYYGFQIPVKEICSAIFRQLRLGTHERLNDVRCDGLHDVRCRIILLYIIAHTRDACIQQYTTI